MKKNNILIKFINLYMLVLILLATIPATLILFVPKVNLDGNNAQKMEGYILATVFWFCLIMQLCITWFCGKKRRKVEEQMRTGKDFVHASPGVISFMKTREGLIADACMCVSMGIIIAILWMEINNQWMILGSVSFFYFSFNMHCILNGKNYRLIKFLRKNIKEHGRDE